ncbi:MAG: nucleotidyltransferase domain-containing protein [Candidatus Aegiribacteria sp.]|nr:nucleotidyltransferase domain-containing protein [Candidatus Aegiribacteria sp.]
MNMLTKILSSRTRAEIFTILFGLNPHELHIREIARRSELSEATIRQELNKLAGLDLVTSRRESNRVYYCANRDNPLYKEIHSIVLKTTGLVDVLRVALEDSQIEVAFVFGSFATGEESANSDIDLMIIGDIGLRAVSRLLSGVSERIEREINPHIMTREEYLIRRVSGDHFVTNVLKGPKLFVKEDQNEFEELGE